MAANRAAETTAQIIMTKPDDTLFRPGTKAKRQLKRTAVSITLSTAIFFLATGIIMAMNIPYIAIPRASLPWSRAERSMK